MLEIIRNNRKIFITVQLFFWLTFIAGIAYSAFNEEYHRAAYYSKINSDFGHRVLEYYKSDNWLIPIGITFGINLVIGTFIFITIPSFFISGFGIIFGCLRTFKWGVTFLPPIEKEIPLLYKIYHLGIIFLEGEGYILAMFGALVVLSNIFKIRDWMQTRKDWIKANIQVYKLVVIVLFLAATVEVAGFKILIGPKL